MQKPVLVVLGFIVLLVLSGCARLVFVRGHDNANPQIYRIVADGTGEENLSQTIYNSSYPDPAPDGSRIAFTSSTTVGSPSVNVFLMPAAGGERTQLTVGDFQKSVPRWGWGEYADRLVYSEVRANGTRKLYIANTAGAVNELTNPDQDHSDTYADIYYSTAEAKFKVIFSRKHTPSGRSMLFTIDTDGSNERRIFRHNFDNEEMPVVSHDNQRVAFRATSSSASEIFESVRVMTVDTWHQVSEYRLPFPDMINIRGIGWSRSNRKLYVSMETSAVTGITLTEERAEIFSMRPDGSDLRRLTRNTVPDYWPNGIPCNPFVRVFCSLVDVLARE